MRLNCGWSLRAVAGGLPSPRTCRPTRTASRSAVATVTYLAERDPERRQVALLAANMQASGWPWPHGADEAVLVRPDGVVLEAPDVDHLLG